MKKILLSAAFLAATITGVNAQATLTLENQTYNGASFGGPIDFSTIEDLPSDILESVTVDLELTASTLETYANDFTIIITENNSLSSPGELFVQLGGFSNFGATNKYDWTTGDSEDVGTVLAETFTFPSDIDISDKYVWIGNGYANANPPTNSGSWSGTVTFNFVDTASTGDFASSAFSIYPNPAKDIINVANSVDAIENVTITDMNGRVVKQVAMGVNEGQINISDLNAGVYFVNINSNEGSLTTKIVKQ
ncbi:MAG: T9SS type A sorting domain-containing protein [Flavobacteriaceae bacterium]